MIERFVSLPTAVQSAAMVCVVSLTLFIPVVTCLWPRTDDLRLNVRATFPSKENCHEDAKHL